jgi:hypothetical protein
MDQIDASLRGSLEKHEQKILPGFKGMKLEWKDKKGNAIDTKKSFKAQWLAIEDINYEETQIKELAVFKDPRGYTKSLPRSVVRKIYKDQPEAVKSLEWPRCVADIALYHAITATKGELTPENFKKESTKYRTYDSTTWTVTYKYTELTGLLNSYKDSTYTTLTARFTTEKLTPEQVDQSLIHGLIKWPAASEFMTRQSKVGERTTEVVATTKVFTLAEMTTETVLIKNSLTLGKFWAVQESFELNTAWAKPLYEYTVDANPWFPQKQKIHIDPQTVLSLDATARKTYLSELRDTEQKKFVDQKWNHIANIINKDRDTELNGKELEYNSWTDTPTDASDDKQFVLTDPSDTTFKVTIPWEDFYKKFFENKKQWILDKSK